MMKSINKTQTRAHTSPATTAGQATQVVERWSEVPAFADEAESRLPGDTVW
jgi:hypothetical protein